MVDNVNEKLREYGNKLIENAKGNASDLEVLKMQRDLLTYSEETNNETLQELMNGMMTMTPEESKNMIDQYIKRQESELEGTSNSKSQSVSLSYGNPSVPKYYTHDSEDGGFTNIILLSIALIVIVIVILGIIVV